jgi:flagellar biosynthesis component FlhA
MDSSESAWSCASLLMLCVAVAFLSLSSTKAQKKGKQLV